MKKPELYVMDIDKLDDEALYQRAYSFVSKERQEKADRFRFKKDKCRTIAVELLITYGMIRAGYPMEPRRFRYRYNEKEKPYIIGVDQIFFNASHSGKYTACAFYDKEVGCDIQETEDEKYILTIAGKYFMKEEYEELMNLEGAERNKRFYFFWCRHESYGKYTGEGFFGAVKFENAVFYKADIDEGYNCIVCTEGYNTTTGSTGDTGGTRDYNNVRGPDTGQCKVMDTGQCPVMNTCQCAAPDAENNNIIEYEMVDAKRLLDELEGYHWL